MVEKICEVCRKKFWTIPAKIKAGKGKFCSRLCLYSYNKKRYSGKGNPSWKGGPVTKKCIICNKKFETAKGRLKQGRGKFCSKQCHNLSLLGKPSGSKGKKFPERSNERHPAWKGDSASYSAKHYWISGKMGLAKSHKCSLVDTTCKGRMEWSNISKKYLRVLSDWWILCTSHHMRYDMTDERRKNIGKAHLGKKLSEETKLKMSLIHRIRTNKICLWSKCKKEFYPRNEKQKCCSHSCGAFSRYNHV